MTYLPFRILLLGILLPPVLYILTMESIQRLFIDPHLEAAFEREIENIAVGDTRPLLRGTVRLKEAIEWNIDAYLADQWLINLGVAPRVTVVSHTGTVLYPSFFDVQQDLIQDDPMDVAVENLRLMNQGRTVQVDLRLGYDTWLSLILLFLYISAALGVLYFFYRRGLHQARQEDAEKDSRIQRLLYQEQHHLDNLKTLGERRAHLKEDLHRLKQALEQEKRQAERTEDEMVDELVALEERMEEKLARHQEQEAEIAALKSQIQDLEALRSGPARRASAIHQRRFKVLYKNLTVNDRAITGFADLSEDLQIKGEEVIHQLNENPERVSVKRKVFSKKGSPTVLEVVFGYKGRLYYRSKEGKVEVVTIGSKNTQGKDLEYLNRL